MWSPSSDTHTPSSKQPLGKTLKLSASIEVPHDLGFVPNSVSFYADVVLRAAVDTTCALLGCTVLGRSGRKGQINGQGFSGGGWKHRLQKA